MTRPRKRDILVEHRPITDTERELRRQRQTFEQRERRRLGLAPSTPEPTRKAPSPAEDRALKDLLCRGYSEQTARAILAGKIASPTGANAGGRWLDFGLRVCPACRTESPSSIRGSICN
jgi:hypothetical protein